MNEHHTISENVYMHHLGLQNIVHVHADEDANVANDDPIDHVVRGGGSNFKLWSRKSMDN